MDTEEKDLLITRIRQLFAFTRAYAYLCHGPQAIKYFENAKEYDLAKHTTVYLLYSYLYSIFDKKGVYLRFELFPEIEKKEIQSILDRWESIRKKIELMRHNQGFHGSKKLKGFAKASEGFRGLGSEGLDTANSIIKDLQKIANKSMDLK